MQLCGSLREVHLLLRGVLQTRHQVTVVEYEITDPLRPCPTCWSLVILKSSCTRTRARLTNGAFSGLSLDSFVKRIF